MGFSLDKAVEKMQDFQCVKSCNKEDGGSLQLKWGEFSLKRKKQNPNPQNVF